MFLDLDYSDHDTSRDNKDASNHDLDVDNRDDDMDDMVIYVSRHSRMGQIKFVEDSL